MMNFELNAQNRTETGKGYSRRLRQTGRIPAVVYGAGKEPQMLTVDHNEMLRSLENEAFYSHILSLNLDGQVEKVVLKDLSRHPAKPYILHVDLMRVNESEKIRMHVPLHFTNADIAVGVKTGGGIVSHLAVEIEISCFPRDLPEFITVDLAALELGHSIHLSELKLPAGVSIVALGHGGDEHDQDQAVVSITKSRAGSDDETAGAAETK